LVTLVKYSDKKRACGETTLDSKIICLVPEHNHDKKFLKVPGKVDQFITRDPRDHGIVFYSNTASLARRDIKPLRNIQTILMGRRMETYGANAELIFLPNDNLLIDRIVFKVKGGIK
jgi:hypothetical protein